MYRALNYLGDHHSPFTLWGSIWRAAIASILCLFTAFLAIWPAFLLGAGAYFVCTGIAATVIGYHAARHFAGRARLHTTFLVFHFFLLLLALACLWGDCCLQLLTAPRTALSCLEWPGIWLVSHLTALKAGQWLARPLKGKVGKAHTSK